MSSEQQLLVNPDEEKKGTYDQTVRPVLAEFVGILLFVFVGCMSVQDPLGLPVLGQAAGTSAVAVALTHGLAIALLVAAFGAISGGHFNPAVTVGILCVGGITPILAALYVVAQLLGAIVGAAFVRAILPNATFVAISGGGHDLNPDVSIASGILCEVLLTIVLVMTVLLTAVDEVNKSSLAPLAIGFAVVVDILAGINVTGASMNPARSLGPAIAVSVYKSSIWNHNYVYWVGPLLGACVAALIYRLLFASPDKRILFKR